MRLFTITIGPRGTPRLHFEAIALDSATALAQHVDLARPGERVEIKAVRADAVRVRVAPRSLATELA